jgi:hypothetical protein
MSERKEDEAHRGPKARSRRIIFWASRRRKREMIRDFPVERVTRIELAWPAWKTRAEWLWLGGFLTCKEKDRP